MSNDRIGVFIRAILTGEVDAGNGVTRTLLTSIVWLLAMMAGGSIDCSAMPGVETKRQSPTAETNLASLDSKAIRTRTDLARLIFDLTNERRRAAGLSPLLPEGDLSRVAVDHSRDMLLLGYFGHVSPKEGDFERRLAKGHRTLVGLGGENVWKVEGDLWLRDTDLAKRVVADWMASPGHRANLLRDSFTHLGVGVCEAEGEITATQIFGDVQAYLLRPLPIAVSIGDTLDLRVRPYGAQSEMPIEFDLRSLESDSIAAGPFEIAEAPLSGTPPGTYLLRMYFWSKEEDLWVIYPAPEIRVVDPG